MFFNRVLTMNKCVLLLTTLLCLAVSSTVSAFSLDPSSELFIAIPLAHYEYREPSFMKDHGYFYGLSLSMAHYEPFMLKGEAIFAQGKVDYKSKSTGNEKNDQDGRIELRTLLGLPIAMQEQGKLIPYVGFGFRFFRDDSSSRISSTGAWGYNRESNYLYLPLGLEWWVNLNTDWQTRLTIEIDPLWHGFQESDLSSGGFLDITNKQTSGYGIKLQYKFIVAKQQRNYFIEPYFHYWNIKHSKPAIDYVTFDPDAIYTGREPHNLTREAGLTLGVLL